MLKKTVVLFALLLLALSLAGCGKTDTPPQSAPESAAESVTDDSNAAGVAQVLSAEDTLTAFFAAFDTADYEAMKPYCSAACLDTYFHDGDVDGMVRAALTAQEDAWDENLMTADQTAFFVSVEMETAPQSALYGETETSFFVTLERTGGSWYITGFPTGL